MSAQRPTRRLHTLLSGAVTIALCAGAIAGCTVDREATGEALIKDVEKTNSIKLDGTQKACLQGLISSLSIDEINALNAAKASPALQSRFLLAKAKCLVPTPTTVPRGSTPVTTPGTGVTSGSTPSTAVISSPASGSVPVGSTTAETGPATTSGLGVFNPRDTVAGSNTASTTAFGETTSTSRTTTTTRAGSVTTGLP